MAPSLPAVLLFMCAALLLAPADAQASLFSEEVEDKIATFIAIFVLFIVPVVLIVLFWMVHILPEKIAHKRHHPQFEAIRTLCLLSLVFGGLLWPLAWLWAYSKPVMYKMAYGTDKAPASDTDGEAVVVPVVEAPDDGQPQGSGGEAGGTGAGVRADDPPRRSRGARSEVRGAGGSVMELLLLGIYSFFVWLIFIKLKLLPWTTPWKVAVAIFPVVALAIMMLLLNIFAPTTTDVRVVKYVVPIVSQVRGRVIEVPVENNRPVKKGDVLFRIDPTPYQNEVHSLEAQLIAEEAKVVAERARVAETQARMADAQSSEPQLREQQKQATGQVTSLTASLDLARKRVEQNTELVAAGAGNRFDLEQAQTSVNELSAKLAAARAAEQEVKEKLSGRVKGDLAVVAQVRAQIATAQGQLRVSEAQVETTRAQLDNARWDLTQTTVLAPGNGTMVNVMLRPGFFVAGMPFNEVMTFVDDEFQIFAMFGQNELHQVEPGNHAEITLDTYPGRIIKAHVDSVIWAQGQGQLDASGDLPRTVFVAPPGRFPAKLVVNDQEKSLFMAAGARGSAAIYTEHFAMVHIIRKVLLRVASYLDYIIIKHSFSGGH